MLTLNEFLELSKKASKVESHRAEFLFNDLIYLGYRYCEPKSSTWHSALILEKSNSMLCILMRRNGIDLRYYEKYNNELSINNNIVSFVGGEVYRNNYYKNSFLVHKNILSIAREFANAKLEKSKILGKKDNKPQKNFTQKSVLSGNNKSIW